MNCDRREFLGTTMAAALAAATGTQIRADETEKLPPVRTITHGPKHHWFAYYDKLQFDPTGRYVLGNEVTFEHRSPRPDDGIAVGMVDLQDGDRWKELGLSFAWNWQQGCMLQWVPGSRTQVLWNDRGDNGDFCSHILDVTTGDRRTIPSAIYALSPDGKSAIAPDFRRLNDTRPGYGYCGIPDPYRDALAPEQTGLWRIDLASGRNELLFSFARIANFGDVTEEMRASKHWFNHLLYNTDGSRFVFLHRWQTPGPESRRRTRMITAKADGTDLHIVDSSGWTSHFIWRDPEHILAWSRYRDQPGFFLFRDKTDQAEQIGAGVMTQDGHCTYLPGNRWILNDTYPDKQRLQHPYLFEIATRRRVPLGHFESPPEYNGEWRCDTHPRFSPDGRFAVIDSPFTGEGRQMHLIDLRGIVGSA